MSEAKDYGPLTPGQARYSRQILFAPMGEEGQRRLSASRVLLVGCGALGTHLADTLVRAGVGHLRIIDRDFIELNNLQRQVLFDEDDIAAGLPKAEAARRKLARINSAVTVEAVVADANYRNIEQLADGADLLLDGTDNFETRYLINDLAVKTNRPWVYGACVGATGLSLPIVPGDTPCLRCVFEQGPPPELNPTCDTAGILGPVVAAVAAHQAMEALKILAGHPEAIDRRLYHFDAWQNRHILLDVSKAYEAGECPCCRQRRFDYLEGKLAGSTTVLCGRNAVQITPGEKGDGSNLCAAPSGQIGPVPFFSALAEKLKAAGAAEVRFNAFMLKARLGDLDLTLFPDARAIITGTKDAAVARTQDLLTEASRADNSYHVVVAAGCGESTVLDGFTIRGEENDESLRAAIDKVSDKLENRLKRLKGRIIRNIRHRGQALPPAFVDDGAEEQDGAITIKERKQFLLKPMSSEEAALQMEMLGHPFFVFKNRDSNSVEVLYKRKDGHYGLLQPEV